MTPRLQFLPSNPGLCCSALSGGWSADLCSGLCWPKRAVGPNLHAGSSMAQVPCCCLKEKPPFWSWILLALMRGVFQPQKADLEGSASTPGADLLSCVKTKHEGRLT